MRHRHIRAALVPSMIAGLVITAAPMAAADHDVAADLTDAVKESGDNTVTMHLNDSGYGGSFDLEFDVAYTGGADGRPVYVLAPVGWQTSGEDGAEVDGLYQGWDPTAQFDAKDGDTNGDGDPDDVTPCVDGDEHVMTQEQITNLGDSVADIVAVDESHFGEVESEAPIVVLAYNILDEGFYDCAQTSYTAGYFAPDLLAEAGLNTIVIDSYQWSQRLDAYKGTIAHELEHLLMNYSDPGELSWIDEGLADFAQYLTGYGADTGHTYYHQVFHRETSLTLWGGGLQDYGASYTFMQYAWEQAGGYMTEDGLSTDVPVGDFTKKYTGVAGDLFIKTLFQEQANGIEGVQAAIDAYNATIEAGTAGNPLPDVNTLIANWAVAIDEDVEASDLFDLAAIDTQTELSGLTIDYGNEVFYDERGVYQGNMNDQKWDRKPNVPAQSALPYSLSYETFRNPGPDFTVELDAPEQTKVDDFDGDESHWYAGYASQTDSILPLAYDGEKTLEFATWYFIEEGWDYAFVEALVGDKWQTVEVTNAADEVITTDSDPHGNNEEGNGLTGTSGGEYFVDEPSYIEASALLPGGTEDVRIRYSTDAAYLDTGIFVDETSIPVETGDGVDLGETDAQSATWVKTNGAQNNDFLVQLVSPCDITPGVDDEAVIDDASGLRVYRFEGTDIDATGFDTQCLGGQDEITAIITNRPTGDLAYLNVDYDFSLVGTGKAKAKGKDTAPGKGA